MCYKGWALVFIPMSPKSMSRAELVNGRAAMLGCSLIATTAIANKASLIQSLWAFDIQSIWTAIGVYAS